MTRIRHSPSGDVCVSYLCERFETPRKQNKSTLKHSRSEVQGVLYGVLQGPKGACCLPAGPVCEPQREARGFSSRPDWDVFRADKSLNICSRLCHQPSTPPPLSIKLSTACSLPLCSIHLMGKSPPPPRPIALFVYCCDKRGKLIRR